MMTMLRRIRVRVLAGFILLCLIACPIVGVSSISMLLAPKRVDFGSFSLSMEPVCQWGPTMWLRCDWSQRVVHLRVPQEQQGEAIYPLFTFTTPCDPSPPTRSRSGRPLPYRPCFPD